MVFMENQMLSYKAVFLLSGTKIKYCVLMHRALQYLRYFASPFGYTGHQPSPFYQASAPFFYLQPPPSFYQPNIRPSSAQPIAATNYYAPISAPSVINSYNQRRPMYNLYNIVNGKLESSMFEKKVSQSQNQNRSWEPKKIKLPSNKNAIVNNPKDDVEVVKSGSEAKFELARDVIPNTDILYLNNSQNIGYRQRNNANDITTAKTKKSDKNINRNVISKRKGVHKRPETRRTVNSSNDDGNQTSNINSIISETEDVELLKNRQKYPSINNSQIIQRERNKIVANFDGEAPVKIPLLKPKPKPNTNTNQNSPLIQIVNENFRGQVFEAPSQQPLFVSPLYVIDEPTVAVTPRPTLLILKPVARAVAGPNGQAIATPVSNAVVRQGETVNIHFDPDAVAIAGPGGSATAYSDLVISYLDYPKVGI